MITIEEIKAAISDPKNESGFFDPSTGDAWFAPTHEAAGVLQANIALETFQDELNKLQVKKQELANAEGEARKPKPTTEIGADEVPIQKGESGKEMTNTAVE